MGLSIERFTSSVPPDDRWYLYRGGVELGAYRSLRDAQAAWADVVAESGWKPEPRCADPVARLRAEALERWARNRAG